MLISDAMQISFDLAIILVIGVNVRNTANNTVSMWINLEGLVVGPDLYIESVSHTEVRLSGVLLA